MDEFASAKDLLHASDYDLPVIAHRPQAAKRAARWFLNHFPGTTTFAVKANSSPLILKALHQAGIRQFDVASLSELELVSSLGNISAYLMNPVKSRHLIARAYWDYGVRHFALDSLSELDKILSETGHARDLVLFVRIATGSDGARIALGGKYGVAPLEAKEVLLKSRQVALQVGFTFHVGSQALNIASYDKAFDKINAMIASSGVLPDVIDVGGGFPSIYAEHSPAPLAHYIETIKTAFARSRVAKTCTLNCEPGRALVAESASIIVRVEHRRGNALYINDGAYGTLYDAAHFDIRYPVRRIDTTPQRISKLTMFALYGPTCDSADYMPGPFYLPDCVGEGDFLEIGQIGAYGRVLATSFNGFGSYREVIVKDEPMMTMYGVPSGVDKDFEPDALDGAV